MAIKRQAHDWFGMASATRSAKVMVVAELGVNHDGQLDRAVALTQAARAAGADAVKLQLFNPDALLSNQARLAGYQQGQARDAAELLKPLALSVEKISVIRDLARRYGLGFMVTPFSLADVGALEKLGVDLVKIASPDAVNMPLIGAAAGLGLPLVVSTGTCELAELLPLARLMGDHQAGGCLLQCISSYPVPVDQAGLGGILALERRFGLPVGYSDHTTLPETGALAVACGACVIEKHLTYDRAAKGPDHAASFDPEQFRAYVAGIRRAADMVGRREKRLLELENDVRAASRQSLCLMRDLPAGYVLGQGDLTVKRPGTGVPAAALQQVIGRRLQRSVRANDLLQYDDIQEVMAIDGQAEQQAGQVECDEQAGRLQTGTGAETGAMQPTRARVA